VGVSSSEPNASQSVPSPSGKTGSQIPNTGHSLVKSALVHVDKLMTHHCAAQYEGVASLAAVAWPQANMAALVYCYRRIEFPHD